MASCCAEHARVFLTIRIGNLDEFQRALERYNRGIQFLHSHGHKYGYAADVSVLSEDTRAAVEEIYNTNPNLCSEGEIQLVKPVDLPGGKMVIALFKDTPKTSENFLQLCQGSVVDKKSKVGLHYKNTQFFRRIQNYMAQGGDVTRGDGSGGMSIYGGKFKDEKAGLKRKFSALGRGSVGMANSGRDSNTSQFFITLSDQGLEKLDGKHVLFGHVVEGIEILDTINSFASLNVPITIVDCGKIP